MSQPQEKVVTADQIRQRKLTRRGVSLNVLLIGENGTGKRSFISTLCKEHQVQEESHSTKFGIESTVINVHERGAIPIRLRLSLTKNYGYNLENIDNGDKLVEFIDHEFRVVLDEELKIQRNPRLDDNRIHVALYFLRTTARGLNEFDIVNMKRIGSKVNLIPVLSKADNLTEDELLINRSLIFNSIRSHGIEIYEFVDGSSNYDPEELEFLNLVQSRVPFSIISANDEFHKTRTTKWGDIDVEDEDLCDFLLLKNILFGSHLEDFKDSTVSAKYESFRCEQLRKVPGQSSKVVGR